MTNGPIPGELESMLVATAAALAVVVGIPSQRSANCGGPAVALAASSEIII